LILAPQGNAHIIFAIHRGLIKRRCRKVLISAQYDGIGAVVRRIGLQPGKRFGKRKRRLNAFRGGGAANIETGGGTFYGKGTAAAVTGAATCWLGAPRQYKRRRYDKGGADQYETFLCIKFLLIALSTAQGRGI
jgi:hypothetical protein